MKCIRQIVVICSILAILSTNYIFAAALNTDMALTPPQGTMIIRSQLRYTRATDDPAEKHREKDAFMWTNTAVYGLSGKFALALSVPFISVEMESHGDALMDETSLSDFTVMGKYRFWQRDILGSTQRLSALLGLEMPAGEDDLSSNSWDPMLGVVYTYQGLSSHGLVREIDIDTIFKLNTEGDDVDLGDVLRYDLALAHQIWPWRTADNFLMGVLEFNGVVIGRSEIGGHTRSASGGHVLYVSPGLAFVTKRFIFELGAKIPMIQDLHGDQLQEDISLSIGFRFQF